MLKLITLCKDLLKFLASGVALTIPESPASLKCGVSPLRSLSHRAAGTETATACWRGEKQSRVLPALG